jgi:Flp pilus assembly protein TadG
MVRVREPKHPRPSIELHGGRRASRRGHRSQGQTLVEFALVFPLFFTLFMGVVEFSFTFNAILSVSFASRNAALAAAEAGNAAGADCVVLSGIERDIGAPADHARITKVDIYRATATGDAVSPAETETWTRTGSTNCTFPDGTTATLPYTLTLDGYPTANRCNVIGGCPIGTHTTVDYVGVRIYYTHVYITPVKSFLGPGGTISFDRANVMRMEPIL